MKVASKLLDYIMLRGMYIQAMTGEKTAKELMGVDVDEQGTLSLWRQELVRMQTEIKELDPKGEFVTFTESGAPRITYGQ